MKPARIINIHGHLRHADDLPARVRIWREWNVEKFCCACMQERWGSADHDLGGYYSNEDFLKVRREYGDLFIGMAAVRLYEPDVDGAADIQRYREQGFQGLKMIGPPRPYNDERYFPIYDKAQDLGMPILFHTGYLAPSAEDGEYGINSDLMRPYTFDRIARAFPKLKIIGAHLGHPFYHEAISMLNHRNVRFDLTGGGGKKPHIRKVLTALLPHPSLPTNMADPQENLALKYFESFLFGTDNPEPDVWVPAAEYILDTLQIPAPLRERFYYGAAAELFGL